MDFATRLKMPATLPEKAESRETHRRNMKDFLLDSMGITHTANTKVGDAFVRGVSGGERKRVSIIETLVSQASKELICSVHLLTAHTDLLAFIGVYCWDNSTRGLDASSALDWARALRALTDELGLSTIVTLYQAGNGIYDLFDKVLVLDEGEQVFYGPMEQARPFMESQGFICADSANIADFLTGVTVPNERRIREGFKDRFPRNATELRAAFEKSEIHKTTDLDFPSSQDAAEWTRQFKAAVELDKAKSLPHKSALTVSFMAQVKACVVCIPPSPRVYLDKVVKNQANSMHRSDSTSNQV